MNKQLALLDITDPAFEPHPRKHPADEAPRAQDLSPGTGEWWKLSREEKQQGLAGVRAIRAILSKHDPEQDISMAQAS